MCTRQDRDGLEAGGGEADLETSKSGFGGDGASSANKVDWGSFVKKTSIAVGVGGVGAFAGGALVMVGLPAAAAAAGFTAVGPAAGSWAAAYMSAHGSVAAGSAFAMVQSAVMTGTLVSTPMAAAGSVVGGVAAAAAEVFWRQKPASP